MEDPLVVNREYACGDHGNRYAMYHESSNNSFLSPICKKLLNNNYDLLINIK